jgi:hypothetical protein
VGTGEYADVEQILVDWLADRFAPARVLTDLPAGELLGAELAQHPVIQVWAYGGADLNPAVDEPLVDVDCYIGPDTAGEPDRGAARDLAEAIRTALLRELPGHVADAPDVHAEVLHVRTVSRPAIRPYDESPIRRSHAAYRIRVQSRG